MERRQQRAERFHTQGQGLSYSNAPTAQDREEAERGRQRAERFGLELHAEPTGQAEAGQCMLRDIWTSRRLECSHWKAPVVVQLHRLACTRQHASCQAAAGAGAAPLR